MEFLLLWYRIVVICILRIEVLFVGIKDKIGRIRWWKINAVVTDYVNSESYYYLEYIEI